MTDPWYFRCVLRHVSVYVTWLALHTPVSANQVTVLQTVVGLIGSGLVALSGAPAVVCGVAAWQIGCLLDAVDGEVARFRSTQSLGGVYLDQLNHLIVNQAIFLGAGFHFARPLSPGAASWILAAAVAAGLFSMAPQRIARRDAVWLAVMSEPTHAGDPARLPPATGAPQDVIGGGEGHQDGGWPRRLYAAVAAYPNFMNVLGGLLLLDIFGVPTRAAFVAYCLGAQVLPRLFAAWQTLRHDEVTAEIIALESRIRSRHRRG